MHLTWWQWLLVGLGAVVALMGLMAAIGATLPVAHSATVSARVDAHPDSVWALISRPDAFPDWRPDITAVTRLDDGQGPPRWREESRFGVMTFQAEAWDPPRTMTARIADEGLAFGGAWTYTVEPDGDGATLTITENGEVYNPVFRFMSRFVFGHERTLRAYLDAIRGEQGGT